MNRSHCGGIRYTDTAGQILAIDWNKESPT